MPAAFAHLYLSQTCLLAPKLFQRSSWKAAFDRCRIGHVTEKESTVPETRGQVKVFFLDTRLFFMLKD